MMEIGTIGFSWEAVPLDAISLYIETIDVADAGENLICAAIYARFKRRDSSFLCQLIFARTKIIHELTTPRAELEAAVLNASTGHVVKLSLNERHKRCWKITDSQVTLYWLNRKRSTIKPYVRNRKIEVNRLTNITDWFYTKRENNLADLGTRKGAKLSDVDEKSDWRNGFPWTRGPSDEFPIKTVEQISLSNREKSDASRELIINGLENETFVCMTTRYVPKEVGERYKFSQYLIDPNRFRFRKVIRIMAIVLLFVLKASRKIRAFRCLTSPNLGSCWTDQYVAAHVEAVGKFFVAHLTQNLIGAAKGYFFRKTTLEVKQFVDARKYEKKSALKDDILYHSGRVLAVQEIEGRINLADVCFDLSSSTFCVPITDALSPVAYSIVSETHWFDPDVSHKGVESILRYAQQTAFIIGGRALVKSIKKDCTKCRILLKQGLEIAMGPVSGHNLKIAPPFYICQVDICGPFNSFFANKRATVKIWFVVFCCTVTCAVDCRVMDDYSADAFLIAFERFSCRFSYPKLVLPDPGSQLVKGCQGMVISFSDIKNRLSVERGIEFQLCPVGAHYVHGKVERKIQTIKKSLAKLKCIDNKPSFLQWETLGQQISNSINNMPIGLGNKVDMLENLDILSPNRLILGRNNNRCPTAPLQIVPDLRRMIESNNKIFEVWFREWLTSYVPTLVEQPKWFLTERNIAVGDVVLFLKSEKEFDRQYQYGIVVKTAEGKDGVVRVVEVEYQNPNEKVKRVTTRGARDLVVVHPFDEISISQELAELAQ